MAYYTIFNPSNPSFGRMMFFSDCPGSLEVGCLLKVWNGLFYVDADKTNLGRRFSDGQYCYRVENGVIVEKTLCPSTIYLSPCAFQQAYFVPSLFSNCVMVYVFASTLADPWNTPGYGAGVNTAITVDFNVEGLFNVISSSLTIANASTNQEVLVCGFVPDEPIIGVNITSINPSTYGFRSYTIGMMCPWDGPSQ